MLKIIIIVGFLMDKKHLLNLNEIFTKYFNRRINLKKNTSAKNIKGWDSLAQVGLILMIEKKYKMMFSLSETSNLKNIGDMIKVLQKKINEK